VLSPLFGPTAMGMNAPVFTDAVPAGAMIKTIHIQELRDQAR